MQLQVGLIYSDELDSFAGWANVRGGEWFLASIVTGKFGYAQVIELITSGGEGLGYSSGHSVKLIDLQSGSGRRIHIWTKTHVDSPPPNGHDLLTFYAVSLPGYGNYGTGATSWTRQDITIPDGCIGPQYVSINNNYLRTTDPFWYSGHSLGYVDHLLICRNDYVTVQGLRAGQKVELKKAANGSELGEATCQSGQTSVVLSIDLDIVPILAYLKIYDVDGETLLETTPTYLMCAGDIWAWSQRKIDLIRLTSGVIYFDELDSVGQWQKYDAGGGSASVDSRTKQYGSGAFKVNYDGQYLGVQDDLYWYKNVPIGETQNRRLHVWVKSQGTYGGGVTFKPACIGGFTTPSQSFGEFSSENKDWTHIKGTISDSLIGTRALYMGVSISTYASNVSAWFDQLVICKSDYVTISGLTPGQKVEAILGSTNTLITWNTVAEGEASVVLDLSDAPLPSGVYLKIYAPDGTIIETSNQYEMCGGDEWLWNRAYRRIDVEVDNVRIYRASTGESPTTATITATLIGGDGETPVTDAAIDAKTTRGAITPTSAETDENGEATFELSSDDEGLAIVTLSFAGDDVTAATKTYVPIHIFYDVESADENKDYQLFVEGRPTQFATGKYSLTRDGSVQQFDFQAPAESEIRQSEIVSIYRLGHLEFTGIVRQIKRDFTSHMSVSGPSYQGILQTKVVEHASYSGSDLETITDDLLSNCLLGLAPGIIQPFDELPLTVVFDTETLRSVFDRLQKRTGWAPVIRADRRFDFKYRYGKGVTVAFSDTDKTLLSLDYNADYLAPTKIVMSGNEATVQKSIAIDASEVLARGIIEAPAVQALIEGDTHNVPVTSGVDLGCIGEPHTCTPSTNIMYKIGWFRVPQDAYVRSVRLRFAKAPGTGNVKFALYGTSCKHGNDWSKFSLYDLLLAQTASLPVGNKAGWQSFTGGLGADTDWLLWAAEVYGETAVYYNYYYIVYVFDFALPADSLYDRAFTLDDVGLYKNTNRHIWPTQTTSFPTLWTPPQILWDSYTTQMELWLVGMEYQAQNPNDLDAAANVELADQLARKEQLVLDVIDNNEPGTFEPEDFAEVTHTQAEISGTYPIKKITRDLKYSRFATLDLGSRRLEPYAIDDKYRRMIADALTGD